MITPDSRTGKGGSLDERFELFSRTLNEAEGSLRGRRMIEEEWNNYRDEWVRIGIVLAPCRPPQTSTANYEQTTELLNIDNIK